MNPDDIIQCGLCPRGCMLRPGQSGDCRVRRNIDGKLTSVVYGHICAAHVDPIEKKPFYHFLPGTQAFSIATVGCNLHCLNCQNWEISQANPEDVESSECPPEKVVELARKSESQSIAYTYTEPVVYYEYAYDTSVLARKAGIRNVLVTAGYINQEPLKRLLAVVDAATLDIKSISDDFYRKICSGTLKPVQETLVTMRSKIHLEVSNLVVPTLNDSPGDIRKLVKWLKENLGGDTPLHFLGFTPRFKLRNLPPTPANTLEQARSIAMDEGMSFVYVGNVMSKEGQNTYCPSCRKILVERSGMTTLKNHLKDGACGCGRKIYGVWS